MRDLYQKVTDQIIAQLESGVMPWVKSWSTGNTFAIPRNATTNKPYRGINIMLLWDDNSMRYLTGNQCRKAGGQVRKSEVNNYRTIYFFKKITVKDRRTDEDKDIPMLREFHVYHVDQCDDLPDSIKYGKTVERIINPDGRIPDADEFIKATGAKVFEDGDRACFVPVKDVIKMPPFRFFKTAEDFYNTSFHELVHWTGHETRLNRFRNLANRFDTEAYAVEELIAELGAAFVCAEFGIQKTMTQSVAYLDHWLKVLKSDKRAIFTAASKAQQAVDHLRGVVLADEVEKIAA